MRLLKILDERLQIKLTIKLTLLLTTITTLVTIFLISYQAATLKKELIAKGSRIVTHVAKDLGIGTYAQNLPVLMDVVYDFFRWLDILCIEVYSRDGKLLATKGVAPVTRMSFADIRGAIDKSGAVHYVEGKAHLEFWAPILSYNYSPQEAATFELLFDIELADIPRLGYVKLVFDKEPLRAMGLSFIVKAVFFELFFLLMGTAGIYFSVRRLTAPLHRLTANVRNYNIEDPSQRLPQETNDEIGKLATAFNEVTAALHTKELERRSIQEQFCHTQKIESLGRLTGGIAHDFNNIVFAIQGYVERLQRCTPNPACEHTWHEALRNIATVAAKAQKLTGNLLTFSRKQVINPEPVDLLEIVAGAQEILGSLIRADIRVFINAGPGPIRILADRMQMEQALVNLVVNAQDAMPDSGMLLIETEKTTLSADLLATHTYMVPGAYALLSVKDTGTGIQQSLLEKIFEPFWSTKGPGRGTGLGLSMVYGLVKQHNGYITVESEVGRGTCFKIYLPLTERQPAPIPIHILPSPLSKGGTETILVAEDHPFARDITTDILVSAGYTVIEAEDGHDAVQKFMQEPDRIDLCLLDVIMPGLNGKEVLEIIRSKKPGVKALFLSGYAGAEMAKSVFRGDERVKILTKPVSSQEMLAAVRTTLDSEAQRA